MRHEKRATFQVPVDGAAIACELQMTQRGEIYRLTPHFPDTLSLRARFDHLSEIASVLNALLHNGVPWAALASCRNSVSTVGALIEAAEARRLEVMGASAEPMGASAGAAQ